MPQIPQLFITVIYFSFTQCWPFPITPLFHFDIRDATNMEPAAALRTSSYFSLLSLKHHMMYALNCSYPLTVDGTKEN
jgi:hypothetical protein